MNVAANRASGAGQAPKPTALVAIVAVLIGMALVYRFFPTKEQESALRESYHAEDTGGERATRSAPAHVPRRPEAPAGTPSGHGPPLGES